MQSVNSHIPDLTIETKKQLIQKHHLVKLHSNPILPDDIDAHGNLPELRCGWKKCGKTFATKDELLEHVKLYLPHHYLGRFHANCKNVLENNVDLTLDQFIQKVKDSYPIISHKYLTNKLLSAYYNQFQILFKNNQIIKDVNKMSASQKEKAEILFNFRIESQKHLIKQKQIPFPYIS